MHRDAYSDRVRTSPLRSKGCAVEASKWIRRLELQRHPEGGWYRETYRSDATIETARGTRAVSTAIYYLLERGDFSALHRIRSDESWHHYAGGALEIVELRDAGALVHRLGSDPDRDESPQVVLPAGAWFGARPAEDCAYALVGCTVAPGFDFADFEMGERAALEAAHPQAAAWIAELTRNA